MSAAEQTFVIVGAGQAGGEVAVELRKQGYTGRVLLIGEEPHVPYRRPPLSKAYLAGTVGEEGLYITPAASLAKHNIEFIGGTRVTKIDRAAKTVSLSDGRSIAYDKLALTTGGQARMLNLPGANQPNVLAVRSIEDVAKLKPYVAEGRHIVIIGGGFIGLETAAVVKKLGMKVTVLEGLPRVLARVTVPEVSAFFERVHREAGVDIRTGVQIAGFEGDEKVSHVKLGNGEMLPADVVVVGIGLVAGVELAEAAGLALDNGIVVDEFAQTSDPDIVAAGDVTNHPSEFLGRRVRLESVQNAMEQGRIAARSMLGKKEPYRTVPWFWSDQYDLKLQMVGVSTGFDRVIIRGDLAQGRAFVAFYLKDGKLIAVDTVNRPQEFMLAKKLVAAHAVLDPDKLADDSIPLKEIAA
ncbi:3-phenylpropionate/trans-cinnamate dioxygenase ferredoxin reductase subunit [Solimonas aquatica]|uniref:3-phenylpropionate/trans-cinnamate dioxygenase ferredoxin reductase subunit n=1 Tax=Solimonas aquatica TaxID=489703 RepID=A0A1H9J8G3_9GAMM|nr:FAD-dependent oxidoreductase [Solimonas aquatica]SEQ83073.1 3-phenylpropionate/trans-cinnamate dioxygenase ferredoxin reductase subunit [Solimonas aquatica]